MCCPAAATQTVHDCPMTFRHSVRFVTVFACKSDFSRKRPAWFGFFSQTRFIYRGDSGFILKKPI